MTYYAPSDTELDAIGLDDVLAELRRELRMRDRAFPRFVANEDKTEAAAREQYARMLKAARIIEGLLQPSLL